jgi:hypothetical protein
MSALGERGSGLRGRLSLSGGGKGEESERAKSLSRSLVKKRRAAMSGDGGGGRGRSGKSDEYRRDFFLRPRERKARPISLSAHFSPLVFRSSLVTKQNETENEREAGGGRGRGSNVRLSSTVAGIRTCSEVQRNSRRYKQHVRGLFAFHRDDCAVTAADPITGRPSLRLRLIATPQLLISRSPPLPIPPAPAPTAA